MTSEVSLVLDDTLGVFTYGGGAWKTSIASQRWFNGSTQYPSFSVPGNGLYGTLNLTFQGTSIGFYGNTNPLAAGLDVLTVSIDGETPSNYTHVNPTVQTWTRWYQSPTLANGTHKISLARIYSPAFDVAIVKTSKGTVLPQQVLLVEDDDPAIVYSGNWKKNGDAINGGNTTLPSMIPMNNSTTQSATAGDSMTFHFSGTSATVWGIQTTTYVGVLSAIYDLDGASIGKDYSVLSSNLNYKTGQGQLPNIALFSTGPLSEGNHSLSLTINKCVNQTFIFDYITYTPFGSSSSSSTASEPSSAPNTAPKTPVGAIVGGVVGGVVLLLVFALFWRVRRRQQALSEKVLHQPQNAARPGQAIHPFIVPLSSSRQMSLGSPSELLSMTKSPTNTTPSGHTSQTSGSSIVPLQKSVDSGSLSAGSSSPPATGSPSSDGTGRRGNEVERPPPPAYNDIV